MVQHSYESVDDLPHKLPHPFTVGEKDLETISSISLKPWDIHLWLVWHEEIDSEELRPAYRNLLSYEECEQEKRFKFQKDQHRCLVTRALVPTVLSRYVPVRPADWRFLMNLYGLPQATNEEANDYGLVFNVSHTDQLIVLGVAREQSLGVDIEVLHSQVFSGRCRKIPLKTGGSRFKSIAQT